jgi:hypothetical protein
MRSVLRRSVGSAFMRQAYPPYTRVTKKLVDWILKFF